MRLPFSMMRNGSNRIHRRHPTSWNNNNAFVVVVVVVHFLMVIEMLSFVNGGDFGSGGGGSNNNFGTLQSTRSQSLFWGVLPTSTTTTVVPTTTTTTASATTNRRKRRAFESSLSKLTASFSSSSSKTGCTTSNILDNVDFMKKNCMKQLRGGGGGEEAEEGEGDDGIEPISSNNNDENDDACSAADDAAADSTGDATTAANATTTTTTTDDDVAVEDNNVVVVDDDDSEDDNKGDDDDVVVENDDNVAENDDVVDERYSRQIYTLGVRAQSLLRTTTMYIDGPATSGLMYECCKNLVLSGIGHIILLRNDDDNDNDEDNDDSIKILDDLGDAYIRAAKTEKQQTTMTAIEYIRAYKMIERRTTTTTSDSEEEEEDLYELLVYYLRRLNPNVQVSWMYRKQFIQDQQQQTTNDDDKNHVYLCIDRDYEQQIHCNHISRDILNNNCPYVCVQTSGIYGQIFNDFGNNFTVVDMDGETPITTPIQKIDEQTDHKKNNENDSSNALLLKLHFVDGERHDVSKNDIIEILKQGQTWNLGEEEDTTTTIVVRVVEVQTPYRIVVKIEQHEQEQVEEESTTTTNDNHEKILNSIQNEMKHSVLSIRRVKQPVNLSFQSMLDMTENLSKQKPNNEEEEESSSSSSSSSKSIISPELKAFRKLLRKCYVPCSNDFNPLHQYTITECFQKLHKYRALLSQIVQQPKKDKEGTNDNSDVYNKFIDDMKKRKHTTNIETQKIMYFMLTCLSQFVPVQIIMGAIASQEAMKAITKLYVPVQQYLQFDTYDIVQYIHHQNSNNNANDDDDDDDDDDDIIIEYIQQQKYLRNNNKKNHISGVPAAPGLRSILGNDIGKHIQKSRIFVVGAGAIGCELLKNLACIGAGTGITCTNENGMSDTNDGNIVVTDMDTIEKSNLSRQFLFRDTDIGSFKSIAAKHSVLRFQSSLNIHAYTSKVGGGKNNEEDTTTNNNNNPFDNEKFWSKSIDVILNALDNVQARLYMDTKCIQHHKFLIDSGTMGSKGNVQVVIPNESESYSSSIDPPEPEIPLCTIKNFPYSIEHTIQWSKNLFDDLYQRRPNQANQYYTNKLLLSAEVGEEDKDQDQEKKRDRIQQMVNELIENNGKETTMNTANEVKEDLMSLHDIHVVATNDDKKKNAALVWAAKLARKLYYDASKELLIQHPLDSLDEDENDLFWSGTRRPPKALSLSTTTSSSTTKTQEDEQQQDDAIDENLIAFVQHGARLRYESLLGLSSSSTTTTTTAASVSFSVDDARMALLDEQQQQQLSKEEDVEETTNIPNDSNQQPSSSENVVVVQKITDNFLDVYKAFQKLRITTKTTTSSTKTTTNENDDDDDIKKKMMHPVEFEKDDDDNGHVQFITAASNLRAICYGISPVSNLETRKIAGKIIPAMITTTSLVSGLSILEFIKYNVVKTTSLQLQQQQLQQQQLQQQQKEENAKQDITSSSSSLKLYQNAFINLALPFFAFTTPLPAESIPGLGGRSYTLWDRFQIKESKKSYESDAGGITLKLLLKKIQKLAVAANGGESGKTNNDDTTTTTDTGSIAVTSVSCGPYLLYANFLHDDDKELLRTSLWELIVDAMEMDDDDDEYNDDRDNDDDDETDEVPFSFSMENSDSVDLIVVVADMETGEEVELPAIEVRRYRP